VSVRGAAVVSAASAGVSAAARRLRSVAPRADDQLAGGPAQNAILTQAIHRVADDLLRILPGAAQPAGGA
jgi:hypothetical protein